MYRLVLQRQANPETAPFEGVYRYWLHLMREQLGARFEPTSLLQPVAIYQPEGYGDERYAEENVILEWCKTEQFVNVYTQLQLDVECGEINGRLQEPADSAGPYRLIQELNKVRTSGKAVSLLLILASLKSREYTKFFNGKLPKQSKWTDLLINLEAGLTAFFNYIEYTDGDGELFAPVNTEFPHRSSRLFPGCVVLNKDNLIDVNSDPDLSILVWFLGQDHAQRLRQMTPVRVSFGTHREPRLLHGPRDLEETLLDRVARELIQVVRSKRHASSK